MSQATLVSFLPDAFMAQVEALVDQQCSGKSRQFTKSRIEGFLNRYLTHRYGPKTLTPVVRNTEDLRREREVRLLDIAKPVVG